MTWKGIYQGLILTAKKNWFDTCLPAENKAEIKKVFQKCLFGKIESIEHYKHPLIARKGKQRVVRWHVKQIRGRNRKITGILCSGEEITERENTEAREKEIINGARKRLLLIRKDTDRFDRLQKKLMELWKD